ncbi:hypothetical protein [Pararhizobium sp. PWRC1-1]|uniref:hypothetical protein n=1 Tax=Pararhizobium sp. PWRC1-1 TaxID=2804566 RepID=UPI003CF3CD9E
MVKSEVLQNKWSRVLIGIFFIVVGVFVGYMADHSNAILKAVCGSNDPIWCIPLNVALYDLGLRSISYTFIILGVVMALLYNFVAELVSSILSFALNHIANSSKVVIDAMERNKLSREESKSIIIETTSRYMGYYDENSNSIGQFIASNVIDQVWKDGGFWRKDYHSIINVEKLDPAEYGGMAAAYLRWNETTSFTIANVNSGKPYNFSSASSVEITNTTDVKDIIKHYKYDIKLAGLKIFSFDDHRQRIVAHDFEVNGEYKDDGLVVAVRDGDFIFSFNKKVSVPTAVADVVVDEESFISIADRLYQLTFTEPTKRVTFRFNLPHDLEIYHCGLTGRRYGTSAPGHVHQSQPSINRVRIDVGDWTLPGIVTILAWKERMTEMDPADKGLDGQAAAGVK